MINNEKSPVIIFDGVCSFCNFYINLILKIDKKNVFKFATLQSEFGKNVVLKYSLKHIDSVVLLADNQVFIYFDAVLEILKKISLPYRLLYYFIKIIPIFARDYIYKIVAKNRFSIFGKSNNCRVPTKSEIDKFITN